MSGKKYGRPSPGKEMFLSTDADALQEIEDELRAYSTNSKPFDRKSLSDLADKVKSVKDPHYSGAGTQCEPSK